MMDIDTSDTEYPQDYSTNIKLHRAAKKGRVQKLKKLCKSGTNPDANNEQHQSPLFVAALHGKEKAVKYLLNSGADPNHPCHDGSTPVHAACLACCPRILCLLADAGGNINQHDNRGLLPRDWVSYQEDSGKRFKMRKFLEAMRLYAIGTIGDASLSRTTRNRWTSFMAYLRQSPEGRRSRWRRSRFRIHRGSRRFFHGIPRSVFNFFHRLNCTTNGQCWRISNSPREEDISERHTLPSTSSMTKKVLTETDIDLDGCKLQLSDSRYPMQTLYVDGAEGKMVSSKKVAEMVHPDLTKIEEERSSQGSYGDFKSRLSEKNKYEIGGSYEVRDGAPMPTPETLSRNPEAINGAREDSGDVSKTCEPSLTGTSDGDDVGLHGKTEETSSARFSTTGRDSVEQNGVLEDQEPESISQVNLGDTSNKKGMGEDKPSEEESYLLVEVDTGSLHDNSCKSRLMEILEDAFRMELAPRVSELMNEYCSSNQGSFAAEDSLDVDFHSYHGDDTEELDVDGVEWVGECCDVSAYDRNGNRLSETTDSYSQVEMEIDQLLTRNAGNSPQQADRDEEKNFVMEGRHVDIQKMLPGYFEENSEEPEMAASSDDKASKMAVNVRLEDIQDSSVDWSNRSSLFQVSAMDEAAFVSDVSLEVNVNDSRRLSQESFERGDWDHQGFQCGDRGYDKEDEIKKQDPNEGDAPLHKALARMDLTKEEEDEVQQWFGGHGSVRNLIKDYETKIHDAEIRESLKSRLTSLSALLRKEYAGSSGNHPATRSVSDAASSIALHDHENGRSASAPLIDPAKHVSYDESWLWPESGDEDETFEEQLRRSMEQIGLGRIEEDTNVERTTSASGDADVSTKGKLDGESPSLVSPPPPTCTPEEYSPHQTLHDATDDGLMNRVNSSGDCDAADQPNLPKVTTDPESPNSGRTTPSIVDEAHSAPEFSPQSEATKKLIKIKVMRSPTVEAIQHSTLQ
ncbi:uncharacterized protein [Diadema setosum]|uniref:uncharacterized protein n=1 Tax=Diadema setosum TaxID=31175 RepID=UPI003B3BCAD3